jgi:hypothetical protein
MESRAEVSASSQSESSNSTRGSVEIVDLVRLLVKGANGAAVLQAGLSSMS